MCDRSAMGSIGPMLLMWCHARQWSTHGYVVKMLSPSPQLPNYTPPPKNVIHS